MLMTVSLVMLSGCGKEDESVSLPEDSYEMNVEEQPTENRALYLLSNDGYVVPKQMLLPMQEDRADLKQAIQYLVTNELVEPFLPTGLTAVLPENTVVRGINITDDKTTVIDLSAEFLNYDGEKETDILESLTYTATSFDNIDQIKLWVEGEPLDIMPKQQTVVADGYSRSEGINALKTEGVDYLTTTPVTLHYPYYIDNKCYFIPTTNYLSNTMNLKEQVVESLLDGPGVYENVSHVVSKKVEVESVTQTDDLVSIILSQDVLTSEGALTKNVIETMVLTLTEFADINQVELKIEGVEQLTVDQSMDVLDVMSREDVLVVSGF
jgi:germination protein M